MIRTADIDRRTQRSWNKLAVRRVIIKRQSTSVPAGFLNAAPRSVVYAGQAIENCDIYLVTGKRSERRVGVDSDIDALVWMDAPAAESIAETDLVNIGGDVDAEGAVTGGVDYRLVSADRYESFIADRTKIGLSRVK